MRQQAAWLYTEYFSSIDKIVQTTIDIIHQRVFPSKAKSISQLNSNPSTLSPISDSDEYFTAVIHVTQADPVGDECRYPDDLCHENVWNLIDSLFKSKGCNEIIILWSCEFVSTPSTPFLPNKKIKIINDKELLLSNKFLDRAEISNQ